MAISSEAGEILDLFVWDRDKNVDEKKIENELADIVTYCLYLADNFKSYNIPDQIYHLIIIEIID
jgi:NTP pyrophosphatase (non-canonical NTP hydrolase)